MNRRLRLAVIGVGSFGALHARTLVGMAEVELVALVDANLERARCVGEGIGVSEVYGSLEALLKKGRTDGVVIATRTETHCPLAIQAVEAGMHVLIEKPLAENREQILRLQRCQTLHRRVVMVDHLCLFHSLIVPLVEKVRDAGFRAMHFVRHRPESIGAAFSEEHPISFMMVHDLYVAAQMVRGENPILFEACESRNREGRTDMSWATLGWADGRVATFHSHLMLPAGAPSDGWDRVEVFGSDYHSLVTTNPAPWIWTEGSATHPRALEISQNRGIPAGMLSVALRHFIAACSGGEVPAGCRLEDALQLQCWIERLRHSIQKRS